MEPTSSTSALAGPAAADVSQRTAGVEADAPVPPTSTTPASPTLSGPPASHTPGSPTAPGRPALPNASPTSPGAPVFSDALPIATGGPVTTVASPTSPGRPVSTAAMPTSPGPPVLALPEPREPTPPPIAPPSSQPTIVNNAPTDSTTSTNPSSTRSSGRSTHTTDDKSFTAIDEKEELERTASHYASARQSLDPAGVETSALLNLPPPPPFNLDVHGLTVGVPHHSRLVK